MHLPVTQDWTHALPLMQQSVLLSAIRGADNVSKDHPSKLLLRWYRRCVLLVAFGKVIITRPDFEGGGSFTGPSIERLPTDVDWRPSMDVLVTKYLRSCDEVPHHFHLHLMHGIEILGYKHPSPLIRDWWYKTYERFCNDMHLEPEGLLSMDIRLGDDHDAWAIRDEVKALEPFKTRSP